MGVPQLSELDRLKVEKANVLYQLGLEVVLYLTKRRIIVSVENPFGSWLWAVFIRLTLTKSLEDKKYTTVWRWSSFIRVAMGQNVEKIQDGFQHEVCIQS